MDAPRTTTAGTGEKPRRRTTTLRLLECLTSFSENIDPVLRGTEEDPHLSFITALQNNFRMRSSELEKEEQAGKNFSIPTLLTRITSETATALTTTDLARLVARGTSEPADNSSALRLKRRHEILSESCAQSNKAKELSVQGRELHLNGKTEEAQCCFKEADELFHAAVLTLRASEE